MSFIVDPLRFQADGAIINWIVVARRLGLTQFIDERRLAPTLQLRWMLRPDMGMPSAPFLVWRRPKSAGNLEKVLPFESSRAFYLFGYTRIDWQGSMSNVSVDVQAPSGGIVLAFVGAPVISNAVAYQTLTPGNSTIRLSAQVIEGLLVSSGVTVTAVRGIESGALSQANGWRKVELVGLPVEKSEWSGAGVGEHGTEQGIFGEFTDAPNAAVQRLTRGAPPFGWGPTLGAGVPAPLWSAPNSADLVAEMNANLLNSLRGIVSAFPPNVQSKEKIDVFIPAPENSSGQKMSQSGETAKVSPLVMTFIGASSEPFSSLVLGFGTAYDLKFASQNITATNIQGRIDPFDWMITARWDKGLDGSSAAVEYAALVPTPGQPIAPPAPASIAANLMGYLRPFLADKDWRCSVRVSWDRPPDINLFRSRSFGFARAGIAPFEASVALLTKRASGGHLPITVNASTKTPDEEFWRLNAIDREMTIPFNPGSRTVKYAVATQDIYGQWSPWVEVNSSVAQPAVDKVRIVSATLKPVPPASGSVCPTTLTIEFVWDWRIRSPLNINFVGRLYAAANHGDPPPNVAVPANLQRSLSGGGAPLDINFSGDTPSAAGATIIALNEAGDQQVTFGSAQGNETRRYRVTVPNLALDFGATGHIGLALWARGQERIPPQRVGAWGDQPSVTATSDPRPPVVPVEHVNLGSLPDSNGESHARIAWTPQPNAAGYFIYESTETKILLANMLPEPTPDKTLEQRLATLKAVFRNNPSRREFTRRNAAPLNGTSADVTLPRGSTSVHVFVVLGISAGQVESEWLSGPDADDGLIAVAAPRVLAPAAPTIEVRRLLGDLASPATSKARVTITTRPGARVRRIDLHRVRVDDAAKELDTMGPPVATLSASGGGWTVKTETDARGVAFIKEIVGLDSPAGSWKRVWYRAAGWSEEDAARGILPGRSPASTAAWTVIPPSEPPAISPITILGSGGGAAGDVTLKWTSPAPVKKTPIGSHTIYVNARVQGALDDTAPLIALDTTLDKLTTSAPAGSGVWRTSSASGVTAYQARVKRASIGDVVEFAVRITDPLGRMGERILTIPAGPLDPPPDLSELVIKKITFPTTGTTVAFSSTVPLTSPGGSYRVRVSATRFVTLFGIPRPVSVVVDLPVEDIPVSTGVFPPGADPLILRRAPGAGPKIDYVALCRLHVSRFVVRITAPDGRFVEKVEEVR